MKRVYDIMVAQATATEMAGGILLLPQVEERNYQALFVKEQDDMLLMVLDDPKLNTSLWERLLDDSNKVNYFEVPKAGLQALCEMDDTAVFAVAAMLETVKDITEEQLVQALVCLSQSYPIERVFVDLDSLELSKLESILKQETDTMILDMFKKYCLPEEEEQED